jgi:hypothetical protein
MAAFVAAASGEPTGREFNLLTSESITALPMMNRLIPAESFGRIMTFVGCIVPATAP